MSCISRIWILSVVAATTCSVAWADDRSLARLAPADTGLFVEVMRGEDLLLPLTETHVWLTLAELAGQPASEAEAHAWRERIRQTINMDPAKAIRELFARRVAFIGEGPGRAQDAVVMCQPKPAVNIDDLVQQWTTGPAAKIGDIDVFNLPNNVGLAVYDGSLLFGDASPGSRMFRRVLDEVAKGRLGRSLADEPRFTSLLRRVPANPDGILFADLTPLRARFPSSAPATSQATTMEVLRSAMPDLPGPFRGASNLMMALHRENSLLHFTAVGNGPSKPGRGGDRLAAQVRALPRETLLATGAHVDFRALLDLAQKLPRRNLVRVVLNLLRSDTAANSLPPLLEALDSATSIAVGAVSPGGRAEDVPPMAAVAVVVATDQPAEVAKSLKQLVRLGTSMYVLMSALPNVDAPQLPKLRMKRLAGVEAMILDLSVLLERIDTSNLIGELHLCWAVDGTALIVASHVDWLEQILLARQGAAPDLSDVFELVQRPVPAGSETLLVVQSGPISDLSGMWLDYLKKTMPHVLSERYWRGRQPGGLVVRIGIEGTSDAQKRRLIIKNVDPSGPAAGFLYPGDAVVGINGRLFATALPKAEFQRGMVERPNARWVTLLVATKADGVVSKTIPLVFVDPMETLRRARAIGKIGQRIIYYDDVPDPAGPRGFLTIELRESQEPLFAFPQRPAPRPVGSADETSP